MICPNCGAEYRPGFTRCYDCDVTLVDALPEPEPEPVPESAANPRRRPVRLIDPVSVFRSADPGTIAVAESILRSADVPFVVINEAAQDLVGLGRFPGGFNIVLGPIEVLVSRSDADDAQLLLRDLEPGAADEAEADGTE